jgi:beta-glucosidase
MKNRNIRLTAGAVLLAMLGHGLPSRAQTAAVPAHPWMDREASAQVRTRRLLAAMTLDDELRLVFGYFSTDAPWKHYRRPAGGIPQSAGYVPGNPRLGIPALTETDAGLGVASQPGPHANVATALPSGIATAATWDPKLAFAAGRMIGGEARKHGFDVMLAGGLDLVRDPRGGRTFEYAGEDPWLAGTMAAAQVRGIQSNHIISTVKHFAFNDQETDRTSLDAEIDPLAGRMSDLLAFEIAIGESHPGAVMCSYNKVDGNYSCQNPWLLDRVLKGSWGYRGFVMSDWGGTHSTIVAAKAGLDQESGWPFDRSPYFAAALKKAVLEGAVSRSRLNDMAGRILYSMFAKGLFDYPVRPGGHIDFAADGAVSRADAESGMVLLKNHGGVLPLGPALRSIALIGSHANAGVLAGGGSSRVYPPEGFAVYDKSVPSGPLAYLRSSPLEALSARTRARLTFDDGADIKRAAQLAAHSEVAVVFAHEWSAEGMDDTMRLDGDQDALIAAVAKANPHTIVVLETGGPVLMPWLPAVQAVLEAWYPGSRGGEAIARVLTGEVDPSGRLPVTFPRSLEQLPRPVLDGYGEPGGDGKAIEVNYNIEGAAVGYKWFDVRHLRPLFPFGYGLSYTRFTCSGLVAHPDAGGIAVQLRVRNVGARPGAYVTQIYVAGPKSAHWSAPQRLAAFKKVELGPGESARVRLQIDPRLLAMHARRGDGWTISAGEYRITVAQDEAAPIDAVSVRMPAERLPEMPPIERARISGSTAKSQLGN